MSSIIKTVSYEQNETKNFMQKLGEHIGIHLLKFTLSNGEQIDGILAEIGLDYISLLVDDHDIVIPTANVLFFRYSH